MAVQQLIPRVGLSDPTDARVLKVRYDANNVCFREFRDSVEQCSEFVWSDFAVNGPRTLLWVLRFCLTNGGSPTGMHHQWRHLGKLTSNDVGVSQHETLCKIIELGVCYDQLNGSELASFETVARGIQMIQYRWRDRHLGADTGGIEDEKHLLMGTDAPRGVSACVQP